jgi:predicted enzyme related to lactoylglutathione lyase
MSTTQPRPPVGSIGWVDLTIADAPRVRDFYASVVGWKSEGLDMGGYQDFVMNEPASGKASAGVCHARGTNQGLPAQWLIYIVVESVEQSAARCRELGGTILREPTKMGPMGRFCVIRDPAGAVCSLFEAP